ncbi:MAG: hypothetical protein FWG93_03130 [Oscillospiraceae bacterium]|nr:hypothetical protein [Oscillospiraceae bacterium]
MAISVTSIGGKGPVAPVVAPPAVTPPQSSPASKRSSLPVAPAKPDSGLSLTPSATYTKAEASGSRKPSAMDIILSRMAEKIITKQYSEGNQFYKLLYGHIALRIDPSLRSQDAGPSREELLARAKELVGDNGPFSPERVAGQIVGFVNEVSEGDQARTERFREAVHDAFARLAAMSGGEMPALTQKTYDAVMESLQTVSEPPPVMGTTGTAVSAE